MHSWPVSISFKFLNSRRRHWLQLPHELTKESYHYSIYFISLWNVQKSGYQTWESYFVVRSNSLRCSTIQWLSSTTCITQQGIHVIVTVSLCIHVFTPTLSCSVAMTTWHSVFLLIHWHSTSITIVYKSNRWLSSPNLNQIVINRVPPVLCLMEWTCVSPTRGTGIDVCVCMLTCSHLSYSKSCGTKTQNMCSSNKMLIAVGVVTMNVNTRCQRVCWLWGTVYEVNYIIQM